ncbi:MAG: T9SS type A sorting domain-containing protein [Sphingobacteriia bacterium]|nr:T9SS type A sorting domain-containing protein [Sphingobacteriia bacterium]
MKTYLQFAILILVLPIINPLFGQNGSALYLDGVNDYMIVADHNDLDIDAGENYTITLWIKSSASDDYFRIINKRAVSGINPGFELIVQEGIGAFGINLRSVNNTNAGPPFGTTPITDGSWHHLAMVVNSGNSTATIYVDGTAEQNSNSTAIGTESFANDLPLLFGTNNNLSLFMHLTLDDVRFWQNALTDSEILNDMTQVIIGNEPGLLAAWNFENVTGTTVPDLKNNHNGTLIGGASIIPVNQTMMVAESNEVTTGIPVGKGEPMERIVAVNVITQGSENPLALNSITFSLDGTTNISDITQLYANYTFGTPHTGTAVLYGTATPVGGNITINGNQQLQEGNNFFWIMSDVSPSAQEGNFIAGNVVSVVVEGQNYTVTPATGTDKRLILLEHKLLFSGGDYGSVNFRIPALTTANDGSLILAVDARVDVPGDLPNNIDIMVRRSTDLGESWSDAITIADFGSFGASDPALVVEKASGTILCMFASHSGLFQSTPANPIRFQVCRSTDNGITWSEPAEHTSSIYAPTWYAAWLASGSAHQLRNGRIVGAVGVRQNSGNTISNFMIYSDDAGITWNYKPAQASATGDEAKIVELDNSHLMMNIRNQTPDCRKIVVSENTGDSWGTPYFQYELIDPAVNADFIRYTSVLDGYEKSRLLFSTASHPTIRKNLTLFISYDEAAAWPVSKVINPGMSGYSSLTILNDGTIGIAYENGEYEDYQIYFARLSLEWLTDGNDTWLPPVGINDAQPTNFDIYLMPNPVNKTLQVVYHPKMEVELKAALFNSSGQLIMEFTNSSVTHTFNQTYDLSSLAAGLYFLRIDCDGEQTLKKLVVAKY